MFETQVSGKNGARRRSASTAFGSGKGGWWEFAARHLGQGCNTPGGPRGRSEILVRRSHHSSL